MNCTQPAPGNPIDRFVERFRTVGAAAAAAQVSTEMLRQFRKRGFVSTRDRALVMSRAVDGQITAAELLGVHEEPRAA